MVAVPTSLAVASPHHNIVDRVIGEMLRIGGGDTIAARFLARDADIAAGSSELTTKYRYRDLDRETARFASALRSLGVQPGQSVFFLAGRVPWLYLGVLGALRARTVVCTLFSAFGPDPIRQRLELGSAAVLVTTTAQYDNKIAPMRAGLASLRHVILIDAADDDDHRPPDTHALGQLLAEADDHFPIEATFADEPALLHFTSGTTGTPKGALHVHGAVSDHARSAEVVFGLGPGDRYWCTADPGWVTGVSYGILAPFACGATVIVDEAEFDALRWYQILSTERVNVWYTAPTAIRMLMRAGPELARDFDLSWLRFAASVGEPLDAGAVIWGEAVFGRPFHDTWWQTETGSIMIANTAEMQVRPGSMGRPLPWVTATVLATDDDGTVRRDGDGHVVEVGDDVTGTLALRPGWASMFRDYIGARERYESCFVDGWYLAGDLVRRDHEGFYWFVGRADDVIKSAGHLIGPFEVERVLMEHPAVVQAGAYGVPDPIAGEVVHARLVAAPDIALDGDRAESILRDVLGHARRHLGPAVAPRQLEFVDRLPVTRSGKIMRRVLRARELGLPEGDLSGLEVAR